MTNLKRVFAQNNAGTGQLEWFFMAREGLEGPYATAALAEEALLRHIEYCQFDPNRVFMELNSETGEEEWFFVARESLGGPYATDVLAAAALYAHVEREKNQ